MDTKTIVLTEGGNIRLDTSDKKQAKWLKWINASPAIIEKPLHFVFKKYGYRSIEADIARQAARNGGGQTIKNLARRAYGIPNA